MIKSIVVFIIYFDYAILLTIATAMLLDAYKPKHTAPVRFLIMFLFGGVSTAISVLIYLLSSDCFSSILATTFITSVTYIIIFGAITCAAFLCYEGTFLSILFCCLAGQAMKQFAENTFSLFTIILSIPSFTSVTPEKISWFFSVYYVLQVFIYVAVYLFLFFFLIQKFRSRIVSGKIDPSIMLCTIVTTIASYFFTLLRTNYSEESAILNVACLFYDLICCALILFLRLGVLERNTYEQEVLTMQSVWRTKEAQLYLFQDAIDEINIKYHDLKRSVALLKVDNSRNIDVLIGEIEESLGTYNSHTDTGNSTLDTILTQYSLQCAKHHISFSCIADGKLLAGISSTNLVALIGNILENALDAVLLLPEEERSISFSVTNSMGVISIREENPYRNELIFENGMPLTQKSDKKNHGFGMKSIQMIVNKMGGNLVISAENGIYTLSIILDANSNTIPEAIE